MKDGGDRGLAPHLKVLTGGVSEETCPDEGLLQAFLDGDDDAFDDLVRRHEELVLKIVRRFARDPDDARDLAQRTFVRAFEAARRTFVPPAVGRGPPRVPFRRWVIRVAINLAKNHARDQNRWTRVDVGAADLLDSRYAHGPEALTALLAAERAARLRRAVLQLPRRQREVMALRLDAELPFSEIAAALDITENAARVNFHHAAVALREAITSEEDEP
jgi:RNA polymerase sigma-70 factor (ECF subfamily)